MTNEWHVRTVCEAVVLSESIAMYTWILEAMKIMEPGWYPTKIRLIFAHGLITKRLLINLGINDKCVLHGDFYHLFCEVWPNKACFGETCYGLIKNNLRMMLLSRTDK